MKFAIFNLNGQEVTVMAPQIRIYARKSTANDRASCSIEEQVKGSKRWLELQGLSILDEQILEEQPGMGGHLFWQGGGHFHELDNKPAKTRPKLTELILDVLAGRVQLIVVWDFSRLWRNAEICAALLRLFLAKGVLLADRNGLVEFRSAEGFRRMVDSAAGFEEYRAMISENMLRSFSAKRERGEGVALGRFLGYARTEKRKLDYIPAEITLVRRIFTMFVLGENGGHPLSGTDIAKRLTDDGSGALFPEARDASRRINPKRFVHAATVLTVLRSPRYIAMRKADDPSKLVRAKEFL